ncbi:hypothetical protein RCH20_001507 [Psychrobacter sp. PL15]|nr:hypothetical protein [Psychrobacter sp. PL15]
MSGWKALCWCHSDYVLPEIKVGQIATKKSQVIRATNVSYAFEQRNSSRYHNNSD